MIQKTYFKTKEYCKVKFSFTPENAETVAILGLNNDWDNPVTMDKKKDGSFSIELSLPKNTQHEFRYLVNAIEWANDAAADGEQSNAFGSHNSLLLLTEPAAEPVPVVTPKAVKAKAPAQSAKAAKETKPVKKVVKKAGK